MGTDRLSLRAWLSLLLATSALLFFVGIYLERGATAAETPTALVPSSQPVASPAERGSETGEAGHSEVPAASVGGAGETVTEHATEARPFGIDVESPILVGAAIVISLLLAAAVLRSTNPVVPIAIIGFAVLFGLFDALEVSHQVGASRGGLAVIAATLAVVHMAIALLALRLVRHAPEGWMGKRRSPGRAVL
jgi:hypothetical protein